MRIGSTGGGWSPRKTSLIGLLFQVLNSLLVHCIVTVLIQGGFGCVKLFFSELWLGWDGILLFLSYAERIAQMHFSL